MHKISLHWLLLIGLAAGIAGCEKTALRDPEPLAKGSKPFKRQHLKGVNGYTEYKTGNFPVLLSAPHGGTLKPAELPDRTCAACVTTSDMHTRELMLLVDSFLIVKTGCYPHAVFTNLHRVKLDANRTLPEATDAHEETLPYYNAYHQFMTTAQSAVQNKFGRGMVADMHGHGHSIQRIELGYLLSASSLRLTDDMLAQKQSQSSIRRLSDIAIGGPGFVNLIRGGKAMGTLLANRGYPAVPSQQIPYPLEGEDYFSGGYISETYGSAASNSTDAIQFECNYMGVRDSFANRQAFANALSDAILEYLKLYFSGDISALCK